ncbi:MAG: hypothetical protein ACTS73_09355 [Arsenophonus sp. NEOnobi-MAG3]
MICYEKSSLQLQVSVKADITCDPFYELIRRNAARQHSYCC